jgi:hypothetical protein
MMERTMRSSAGTGVAVHYEIASQQINAEALIELCNRLVKADLTATGYRVMLDSLSRLIAAGRNTEAVPLEYMAKRLGIHRNAVSSAYEALATAGVLKRAVVKHRGAPSRTTLIGPAASLVSRRPAVSGASETAEQGSQMSEPWPALPEIQPKKPNLTPVSEHTAQQPAGRAAVNPAQILEMTRSLPEAAQRAALFHQGPPEAFVIDPAWGLTDAQADALRRMLPKETPAARPANCAPRVRASGEVATDAIAVALFKALPALTQVSGCAKRAGEVADEIAYMAQTGRLGHGDPLAGVRAGISLVKRGTWAKPKGFHEAWRGAVTRGMGGRDRQGDARKSVH